MTEEFEAVVAHWGEMAKTRFTDEDIRVDILAASQDKLSASQSQAQSLKAIAKMMYNKSINDRIAEAKKSWGVK
jgi:hypothetical protein